VKGPLWNRTIHLSARRILFDAGDDQRWLLRFFVLPFYIRHFVAIIWPSSFHSGFQKYLVRRLHVRRPLLLSFERSHGCRLSVIVLR